MTDVQCSGCGGPLAAENIDRRLAVARCGHCNALTDISGTERMRGSRPEAPLPPGFHLQRDQGQLQIVHRWLRWPKLSALVYALAVPMFLYCSAGVGDREEAGIGAPFLLFFAAVWGAAGYASLAHLVNHTLVTVKGARLTVRHVPLPWLPRHTLDVKQVEQLYCNQRQDTWNKLTRTSYEVRVVRQDDRSITLVGRLATLEQAHLIEQEIKRELGDMLPLQK